MDAIGGKDKSSGFFSKIKRKLKLGRSAASYSVNDVEVVATRKVSKDETAVAAKQQQVGPVKGAGPSTARNVDTRSDTNISAVPKPFVRGDAVTENIPKPRKKQSDAVPLQPSAASNEHKTCDKKDVDIGEDIKTKSSDQSVVKPTGFNDVKQQNAVSNDTFKDSQKSDVVSVVKRPDKPKETSRKTDGRGDNGEGVTTESVACDSQEVTMRPKIRPTSVQELHEDDEDVLTGSADFRASALSDSSMHDRDPNGSPNNVKNIPLPEDLNLYDNVSSSLLTPIGVDPIYNTAGATELSSADSHVDSETVGAGNETEPQQHVLISKVAPVDIESIYDSVEIISKPPKAPANEGASGACDNVQTRVDDIKETVNLDEHVNFRAAKSKWKAMEEENASPASHRREGLVVRSKTSEIINSDNCDIPVNTDVHSRMKMFENAARDDFVPVAKHGARPKVPLNQNVVPPHSGSRLSTDSTDSGTSPSRQRRSREEIFEVCTPDLRQRQSSSSTDEHSSQLKDNDPSSFQQRPQRRAPDYEEINLDENAAATSQRATESHPLDDEDFSGDYATINPIGESVTTNETVSQNRRQLHHVPSYEVCTPDLSSSEHGDNKCDTQASENMNMDSNDCEKAGSGLPKSFGRRVKRVPSYEECHPVLDEDGSKTEPILGAQGSAEIVQSDDDFDPDALYAVAKKKEKKKSRQGCKPYAENENESGDDESDGGDDSGDDTPPIPSRNYARTPSIQKLGTQTQSKADEESNQDDTCDKASSSDQVKEEVISNHLTKLNGVSVRTEKSCLETPAATKSSDDDDVDERQLVIGGEADREETHLRHSDLGTRAVVSEDDVSLSIDSRLRSTRRHSADVLCTGISSARLENDHRKANAKSMTLPARSGSNFIKGDDLDVIQSLLRLKDCGWYWGPLSYEEAEAKLSGKPDGSFLVRDSADDRYILSLSFRALGKTQHTRIEHFKGLFSFQSQPASHEHTSIVDFIQAAMQHSKDGKFLYFIRPTELGSPPIPVQLAHPISRFKILMSLQHMCRFLILKLVRYDHIDRLPLPSRVKGYLQEQQYYTECIDDVDCFECNDSGN